MKASVEQEDRKFMAPTPGRITAMNAAVEQPHPASWAALEARLVRKEAELFEAQQRIGRLEDVIRIEGGQERAALKLAEALHAKRAQQLDEAQRRIARLEALILGFHMEQGDRETEALDDACRMLDEEGARLHECFGCSCPAWAGPGSE